MIQKTTKIPVILSFFFSIQGRYKLFLSCTSTYYSKYMYVSQPSSLLDEIKPHFNKCFWLGQWSVGHYLGIHNSIYSYIHSLVGLQKSKLHAVHNCRFIQRQSVHKGLLDFDFRNNQVCSDLWKRMENNILPAKFNIWTRLMNMR